MKRRCVPLRGDHNLLTPDTHTQSGVRRHPVVQVRLEGVASHSGRLIGLSSGNSVFGSTRRRPLESAARRLRFEDETEREAESRYQERQQQRKRAGQHGTDILVSKPDLHLYINGRTGPGRGTAGGVGESQCDLNLSLHPPEDRGRRLYRTEPIRETYIGSLSPGEKRPLWRSGRVSNVQVGRKDSHVALNGNTPIIDLPINPYAPDQLTTPTLSHHPSSSSPMTSAVMSQIVGFNGTKAGPNVNQDQEDQGTRGSESELRYVSVVDTMKICNFTSAESPVPPNADGVHDGHVKQPMSAELHRRDTSLPEHTRDESSRFSLHRLISTIRLRPSRSGSLGRLNPRPHPSALSPLPSAKKWPSTQSLNVDSLRRSLTVQTFVSEQKKKTGRTANYRPAPDSSPQPSLNVEDVGRPCSAGRLLDGTNSDGMLLLELRRPTNQVYGFLISRRDSGVYVEDMLDSSIEKMFAGLLWVGDQILEVNGQEVNGLRLDQVTQILNRDASATVRVLRHRRTAS